MGTLYSESRNYNLGSFWKDVCQLTSVRELILKIENDDHDIFGLDNNQNYNRENKELRDDFENDQDSCDDSIFNLPTPKKRLAAMKDKARNQIEHVGKQNLEDVIFNVGRGSGTQELTGQRVLQIATIIRNLSFEEDNATVIAKSLTCLRYITINKHSTV